MDKYNKSILKFLNKYSSKNNPITIEQLYNQFNFDKSTIDNCLNALKGQNLIEGDKDFIPNYNDNVFILATCSKYWSTIIGKEYFKQNSKKIILIIIKYIIGSLIIPIIVAYITTRITSDKDSCCNITNNNASNYADNK